MFWLTRDVRLPEHIPIFFETVQVCEEQEKEKRFLINMNVVICGSRFIYRDAAASRRKVHVSTRCIPETYFINISSRLQYFLHLKAFFSYVNRI